MSGQDDPDRIIGSVTKNARESIAVMLPTHKGYRFVGERSPAARQRGGAGRTQMSTPASDAITIIRSIQPGVVCKRYTSGPDGTLQKTAVANITKGVATSHRVPDAASMVKLLAEVTDSTDKVICPGVWRGDNGTPFDIVTERALANLLGVDTSEVKGGIVEHKNQRVAARLKRGIEPSCWVLFDADNPPGMPSEWAAMSIQQRLELWEPILRGASKAERIELRASSARVVSGAGGTPRTHAWVRVSDASKIVLMKAHINVEMVNRGLSFPFEKLSRAKGLQGKVVGVEHRGIFDLAVFDTGRLVFCAKPDVRARDYLCDTADIQVVNEGGGVLDISRLAKPSGAALDAYRQRTGIEIEIKVADDGGLSTRATGLLKSDTPILQRGVTKPLCEWVAGLKPGDKLRCESPFRESVSEAAFIRIADNGEPFVHDVGNSTTYRLDFRDALRAGGAAAGTTSDGEAADIDSRPEVAALIREFNSRYKVVNENGRVLVYEETFDAARGRRAYLRYQFEEFHRLHTKRRLVVGRKDDGTPIYAKAAKVWLDHPAGTEFPGGVVFDPSGKPVKPGVLNLWRGFAVAPKPGTWAKLQAHMLDNICDGNHEHYNYLTGWLARVVQFPATQGEVALVMRGGEGTGKGTLAKALLHLLGQHGLAISNSKHLVGNFNGHLRDVVGLFVDEAFFAGDKAHVGTLKSLITEPMLTVEGKFQTAVEMPNMLHVIMASNEDWVVPASPDARRFFVLNVRSDRANDHAYFAALHEELTNGGYEAMLFDLLNLDLEGFNHRQVPQTRGLAEQKALSLSPLFSWYQDVLTRGHVLVPVRSGDAWFYAWHEEVSTQLLFASYVAATQRHRNSYGVLSENIFGKSLRTELQLPMVRPRGAVVVAEGVGAERPPETVARARVYRLGTLAEARTHFEEVTNLKPEWGDDDDDGRGIPKMAF